MLKIPARFKQCDLSVSLAFDYCDCILNMGTRAAAFTAKVRSLCDYQLRLMQGVLPPPSGVDIANTIKYFSQTLLTVLKDVTDSPLELLKDPEMDATRLALFPSLDYKALYNSLIPLMEVAPLIQYGLHAFGQAILQCLGCLLPFLEHDLIDNLPYLTASSVAVLPSSLHQDIVNSLCFYILPFTITRYNNREHEICQSISAVIMMVFQYSSNPAHHCQLLECLMTLKQNILKDILSVIAYGASTARSSAAKLLFYYWPPFNANLFDRKGLICKFADSSPFVCQRDSCPNAGSAEAAKVCYDHCISITFAADSPPPLYLCIECANEIHREHPNQMFFDILHPMQQKPMICENKNCRSTDKSAISICFSTECASYNGNHPIRYCEQCHNNRHNTRRGGDHIVHKCVPATWNMDIEMQTYMVEAVVSLLKEAKIPVVEQKEPTDGKTPPPPAIDNITIEERQQLGKYGVWLLVGRCSPVENTPEEVLGRLLAMLFHWFHVTAYSYDVVGQEESTLEKLKNDHVCDWLKNIAQTHYKLFISCLLPHPPEFAQVGGHWDTLASRTSHLKDGLTRLFCLTSYDNVITQEIWDFVMPHWMDAIVNDVPEKELPELRTILNKILEAQMCDIEADIAPKKVYNFVAIRFDKTTAKIQQQALQWLQILTMLEITIKLEFLYDIFGKGVNYMKLGAEEIEKMMRIFREDGEKKSPSLLTDDSDSTVTSFSDDSRPSQQADCESDAEHNLFCCILMLDILLKQMELQAIDKHTGLNSDLSKNVCGLLKCMLTAAWIGSHSCSVKSDCGYCESSIMWHQLSLNLVKYMSPIYPVHPPDPPIEDLYDDQSRKSPPDGDKKECKADVVLNVPIPEVHSVGGVLVNMPHVCSIMTATVETVSEQLDLPIIQSDSRTVLSVQRAYTLTEYDDHIRVLATPIQSQATEEALESPPEEDTENCWQTSIGKFKFCVEDLPNPLQYIYQLLQELSKTDKPDVLYYMLQCLNVLCLHGDACTKSSKDHRGFFIWCQENLIIRNLWDLLNSEHSHICQEVVPLLLHCITLPAGSDVFWRVIQEEFHNIDWRVRFVAVERVTVIARFMDSSPLRNILQLQAALANAFCYLISSMDDPNVYVAQRATLYLGTIHDGAIKSLIMCLETQFDSVIVDRPMVLQSIYQLHNSLSERKILTWEFFLNRFDTLFLEAQINFEKSGDISYMRDLRNTDLNSEVFIRKLHRAHEALSHSDGSGVSSVKTLSASFGTKWPYKRTMSAPASIIPRQDNRESREKVYSRQYSAPILKRKTSRFGLDGHVHSLNVVDDQNLLGYLQRVIDLEEADKETMHLLVFLLMQFLSRSDQAYPTEDKYISKSQDIVLRHLYLLLGYSQNDRCHFLPPQRLRLSPAFSVFISNLPQLLDQNHLMGRMLLSTSLILLHYSPSPFYMPNNLELQQPTYSLWSLEPHLRRNWLMALVVLLYKYQYNQQPHCLHLTSLVKIVLNTLDSQHHHCRRIPATILMGAPSTRSRDVSQPSLGAENEQHEKLTTPPLSPMYSDGQSVQVSLSSKGGKTQVIYAKPSSAASMETHWEEAIQCIPDKTLQKTKFAEISLDADDTESELNAIPESDLSDSTLHGSVQDSFDEGTEDLCYHKSEKSCIKVQEPQDQRSPKEVYISKLVKHKRPIWIIGSEEEALKSWESKTYSIQEIPKFENGSGKNCTKPGNVTVAKTLTTDSHRQVTCSSIDTQHISKPTPLGKHKKIIEPCITPVSTPVSDCEECLKNQVLPPPAIERLLPIGSVKPPDSPKTNIFAISGIETQLEIPNQERLLPIGHHTKDISQLVEKVKQALGINAQHITKIPEYKKVENGRDSTYYTQSPRRLIKQVALESPPQYDIEETTITFKSINMDGKKESTTNHRHPIRKAGPFTIRPYPCRESKKAGFWLSPQLSPKIEGSDIKQSSFRIGDECVTERCSECGTVKEEYSDEELGLCIVCLGTFIHREPSLAAPMLPDILNIVAKVATNAMYPWQNESNIHLPGGAVSVAHQFLRCVLHQLAPNGIFTQMFQTPTNEKCRIQFFKNVIQALIDFNELNPVAPLQLLLETLNSKKTLPLDALPIILENLACYMDCLPLEAALGSNAPLWNNVLQQMETFFRRIVFLLHGIDNLTVLLRIIITIFKIPLINQYKGMLEPFSKIMSHAIQTNVLKYNNLVDICFLCNRAFTKDRDKMLLSRMVVFELVQALKFKTCIPDANLLMLINLILQDVGGSIPANVVLKDMNSITVDFTPIWNTNIAECMKVHLTDILEFLTDFHTLAKIKSYSKGISMGLNEDTLGGIFKCNVAQYLALEISRGNGRDNRAVSRYLPWLYNTSTAQQPPKEFVECIGHVRLLSWLLLGSLTHTAIHGNDATHLSQPIPQEASCQIADHIQVIMAGFAEQPKASVLHMSSLFHTFILCQLWTIYLEQGLNAHLPITEAYNVTMNILFDFWGKITPCILQLVQQSKVLSEIVCLHFLNLIEALIECHSTFITKLFPLWIPVLTSQTIQLPGHLQVRLQNCLNFAPDVHLEGLPEKIKTSLQNPVLLRWLQRLQFKMGQIELQSSTATQFYSL